MFFGDLFENKIARSLLKKMRAGKRENIESLADEAIQGIEYYFIWENKPPELTPAVRMVLKNQKKKILLTCISHRPRFVQI
jgi:hypothetical protein